MDFIDVEEEVLCVMCGGFYPTSDVDCRCMKEDLELNK